MKIEIQGELCVASGKNWSYKKVGNLSVFEQTGKVPSLRVIKSILKLHLRMHDIGAKMVNNNIPYIKSEFDGVLTLAKSDCIAKTLAVNSCARSRPINSIE